MTSVVIEGQLNTAEREVLANAILKAPKNPQIFVEVGGRTEVKGNPFTR